MNRFLAVSLALLIGAMFSSYADGRGGGGGVPHPTPPQKPPCAPAPKPCQPNGHGPNKCVPPAPKPCQPCTTIKHPDGSKQQCHTGGGSVLCLPQPKCQPKCQQPPQCQQPPGHDKDCKPCFSKSFTKNCGDKDKNNGRDCKKDGKGECQHDCKPPKPTYHGCNPPKPPCTIPPPCTTPVVCKPTTTCPPTTPVVCKVPAPSNTNTNTANGGTSNATGGTSNSTSTSAGGNSNATGGNSSSTSAGGTSSSTGVNSGTNTGTNTSTNSTTGTNNVVNTNNISLTQSGTSGGVGTGTGVSGTGSGLLTMQGVSGSATLGWGLANMGIGSNWGTPGNTSIETPVQPAQPVQPVQPQIPLALYAPQGLTGIVGSPVTPTALTATEEEPAPDPAWIVLTVPNEAAKVYLDKQLMEHTGLVRKFVTDPLERGKDYTFACKVTWKDNPTDKEEKVMERTFKVQAGDEFYTTVPITKATEAQVAVAVPNEKASLSIDDTTMKTQGLRRTYKTVALDPNKYFHYMVRVNWTDAKGKPQSFVRNYEYQAGDMIQSVVPPKSAGVDEAPVPKK